MNKDFVKGVNEDMTKGAGVKGSPSVYGSRKWIRTEKKRVDI